MSSVSAVAALGEHIDTPPEEIRPNLSYLTVTPNVVATPPTGKRKSVDLALQGFGQFTPMMADYIYNGMKDSDTSADSLNLMSASTGQSSSTQGVAGATPSPSKDPAAHLRSLGLLRKSSLRVSKGRYTVNQPLSAAAAHPMVDKYTEELYRKMPEKYGSLAGRKSTCTENVPVIAGAGSVTTTEGGSDSGAEILLPVPSRSQRRESLLSPRKHGYEFTLPTAGTDKTYTATLIPQERHQSKAPRKSSVSHERRHSKSLESLKGQGRKQSRSSGVSKEKDRRHSKSHTSRQEHRHPKGNSKDHEKRQSKSTRKSEDKKRSKSHGHRSDGRKRSRSGASTEGESRHSNSPGERRQSKSSGILKDKRRYSRADVTVIIEERRSSNSSAKTKERRNSNSSRTSPKNRRNSRSPALQHARRQSRGRELHSTSNNSISSISSSSSSRSSSSDSNRQSSCESDSSASAVKNQRSSTFDLFTCSPMHKRWVLPYSCGGGRIAKAHTNSGANRFQSSVAPACLRAYSALKCLFFRPTKRDMRAETKSISSDDDAEIEEEEGSEKESEGDGDDEAEDYEEKRDMLRTSRRSDAIESRLGVSFSLRTRPDVECLENMGLPTCRVTVTVEEADEEDASSKEGDTQEDANQTTPQSLGKDSATDKARQVENNLNDTPKNIKCSADNDTNANQKKKLPLTACDSGIQDNSPSMENSESFTMDTSIECPTIIAGVQYGESDSSNKKETRTVDVCDYEPDEIILDSDLLVEIDECMDSVFHDEDVTTNACDAAVISATKQTVKATTGRQHSAPHCGKTSGNDSDLETVSDALLRR
ncbi:hypothetical protein EGW08_017063 [Elysia chlorotica]|uniref:Uncharacterized protein n=1 Tax=Elysia chlorotica TaxID=188477 RepID=A0A433T0U9_ELYCH|nr:hypothetical protein EGW08_017063 [Elysia chlorotica]